MAMMVSPVIVSAQNATGGGKQVVNQQGVEIYKGTVFDDTNMPLPGAHVKVKGKSTGGITDSEGNFQLKLPKGKYVLEISYIGMKPVTVKATSDKDIIVYMSPDAQVLKETVVTGIYTRNIESFTGAVTTYTAEELKQVSPTNLLKSLSVLDPSFIITENRKI